MKFRYIAVLCLLFLIKPLYAQNAPTQLAPVNNASMVPPAAHTLSWYYISTSPVIYELQVSLSDSFSGTLVLNTTINGINLYNNIPGLFGGTKYYWRVRATNANGTSDWSSTWAFTTSGTPPQNVTITASAGSNGNISPAGITSLIPGSDKTFSIVPDENYEVEEVLVNGVSVGAVSSYTFLNVLSNQTISASFNPIIYNISASAGAGGTISPSGSIIVSPGDSREFIITPDAGYHITDVLVDGVSVGAVTEYTFDNIQNVHSISAAFAINTYNISVTSEGNGSIEPAGDIVVNHGSDQNFTFTPQPGNFIAGVLVNGVSAGSNSEYTFTGVTSDQTLHVIFADHYIITASAGEGGSITPQGEVEVTPGADQEFTVTPELHFSFSGFLVDGNPVAPAASYTFLNVQESHSIEALFEHIQHTITAVVHGDSGGTISPAGSVLVNSGEDFNFMISPDEGYIISKIEVDGISVPVTQSYNFTSVSADHDIEVFFKPVRTIYVSPAGDDLTGDGSADNPFQTISTAFLNSIEGDTIKAESGSYDESVSVLSGRMLIGGENTYVRDIITLDQDDFIIKNIKVQNSTSYTGNVLLIDCSGFTLDNIIITDGEGTGLFMRRCNNFQALNMDVSFIIGSAIIIEDSYDFELSDITANNNYSGILIDSVSYFEVNNITASYNKNPGIIIHLAKNGELNNLTCNENQGLSFYDGLQVLASSNLTFTNGEFLNQFNGILIAPTSLAYGYSEIENVNNITFLGNFNVSGNYNGIALGTDPFNYHNSVVNSVFNGKFLMSNNLVNDVSIYDEVYGAEFKGFEIQKPDIDAFFSYGFFIGSNGYSPQDITINNCVFHPEVVKAIYLNSGTESLNVDARYNDFMGSLSFDDIQYFIYDINDAFGRGLVDFSGSSFGSNPEIALDDINSGYKGATYLIDVYLDMKQTEYYFIKGKYTYDVSKLDYLGYTSNGLFNQAQWNLTVTETSPGVIEFTGFGITPITADGSLFKLNMKILSGAAGSTASIAGAAADFTGNSTAGEFIIDGSDINYTDPPGALQELGDVTLDAVVTIDDFYTLLYHLAGVSVISEQDAIANGDFDGDNDLDGDDLNSLYSFITTGSASAPAAGSGIAEVFNISYDELKTSAAFPFAIREAENVKSAELILSYDPSLISFKAFTSALYQQGYLVHAFESKPGEARFVLESVDAVNGNVNAGSVILNFKNGVIPEGTIVRAAYKLNGFESGGSDFILHETGVVTDADEVKSAPDHFELAQNFPNPFNPATTINFSLPYASDVSINIYDMLGQKILTLVNQQMNAGTYSVNWNGRNENNQSVTSGTYIYRITAGEFVQSRKMIMMK